MTINQLEKHMNTSQVYLCNCLLYSFSLETTLLYPVRMWVSFFLFVFFRSCITPRLNTYHTYYFKVNEVAAVEPPPVVPYSPNHQSNTDTFAHNSQRQPEVHPDSGHRPDLNHPTHPGPRYPSNPDSQYPTHPNPDARYQPDPQYPAPKDPRFPSYSDRLNQPDSRYSVYTTQERPAYPDTRNAVTPQRRPPPPLPQSPVHHHTSGPAVGRPLLYSHLCSKF